MQEEVKVISMAAGKGAVWKRHGTIESPSLPSKAGSGTYSTLTGHGHLEGHVHSPCSKPEVLSWCSRSFIS